MPRQNAGFFFVLQVSKKRGFLQRGAAGGNCSGLTGQCSSPLYRVPIIPHLNCSLQHVGGRISCECRTGGGRATRDTFAGSAVSSRAPPSKPFDTSSCPRCLPVRRGLYLMTDWLPIRKHFIRPRNSKQVKQSRQGSISHHLSTLKAKTACARAPCASEVSESSTRANPGSSLAGKCAPLMTHVGSAGRDSDETRWMVGRPRNPPRWLGADGKPEEARRTLQRRNDARLRCSCRIWRVLDQNNVNMGGGTLYF